MNMNILGKKSNKNWNSPIPNTNLKFAQRYDWLCEYSTDKI